MECSTKCLIVFFSMAFLMAGFYIIATDRVKELLDKNSKLHALVEEQRSLLEECSNSLEDATQTLGDCTDTLESCINDLDRCLAEKEDLNKQFLLAQQKQQLLAKRTEGKIRYEISFDELVRFLHRDNTEQYVYDSNFTCAHFTDMLIKRAAEQGIFACRLYIEFENIDIAHSAVAFKTKDKGIVYVEPQTDAIIFKLHEGDNYYRLAEMGNEEYIVKSYTDCFEVG